VDLQLPADGSPRTLPVRRQAEIVDRLLEKRLERVLPAAMRAAGVDMWVLLCREDNLDPVFKAMLPVDTWCPILGALVFFDRGEGKGVERLNVSATRTAELYECPWGGRRETEQWKAIAEAIVERDPRRIGVNVGDVQWCGGGLTHSLYQRLAEVLPAGWAERLVSAEAAAQHWGATLIGEEVELFDGVAALAHRLIAACYTREVITPGKTTTGDLEWHYRQLCADLGLEPAFKPSFYITRGGETEGPLDGEVLPGDFLRCDVGTSYLRLTSDHQRWAWVRSEGEPDPPEGMRRLMREANRLQDVFLASLEAGLTGNGLLKRMLERARAEGIPNPKVYSHSLGHYLHEPGPLIGLPWEQESCPGRGDAVLGINNCFAMELSVRDAVPEWGGREVTFSMEEDVVFTKDGPRILDGRQTEFVIV
jgi:hypothetical protein